jgi:kumamolisin
MPTGYLSPLDVARAYQLPDGDGTGVTVGMVQLAGPLNETVFDAYCFLMGVSPPRIQSVSVDGRVPVSNGKDSECHLDSCVMGVLVPAATIKIYYAPDTNQGLMDAIQQAASECDVVSASWVYAESFVDPETQTQTEEILREARSQNVSVFIPSGDWGSDGWNWNRNSKSSMFELNSSVPWPACCPSAVSVGATILTIDDSGNRIGEIANSISGGGLSMYFPDTQCPVVSAFGYEGPSGGSQPGGFPVPDASGTWRIYSDTSGSCPFMAALHARLIQHWRLLHTTEFGTTPVDTRFDFMDFVLWANQQSITVLGEGPMTGFHDITEGSNGAYSCTVGRDLVTGIGSPNGPALLPLLSRYRSLVITARGRS